MKTFKYFYPGESLNYEVEFIQGNPLKYTHLGKTYAKMTQYTVRVNSFILGVHKITKHNNDNDNLKYAYMNSFKPLSKKIMKEARIDIIKQILEYTKND